MWCAVQLVLMACLYRMISVCVCRGKGEDLDKLSERSVCRGRGLVLRNK